MSRCKCSEPAAKASDNVPANEAVMTISGSPFTPLRPIAGLILASGRSERFGAQNKLLAPFGGIPIVRHTLTAYVRAELQPVFLVVGHQAEAVEAAAQGLGVTVVDNPDYRSGQSRALVRGIRALPPECEAVVVGVGDQPLLTESIIGRLTTRYRETGATLVVPRYRGVRGNPVLFDRSHFDELQSVAGDQGGRSVVARHAADILWVDIDDPRPAIDIDTKDDYRRVQAFMPEAE